MKNNIIKIGQRKIGPGHPTFVIAELSANHHHDYKKALRLIDAAARAGADAIKLQTYTPDTITINCDNKYFQVNVNKAWRGQTLYSLYEKAYTPWEWQAKLKKYAASKGLLLFSTPFDETAVDFLEKINVSLYKIASFEVVDIPLLKRVGKTKKPVIISRGMATLKELRYAVKTLKENGTPQVAVLHCVSSYPADYETMNLRTIPDLEKKLGLVSGLSDHTIGATTAIAAVALGAAIIEKHIIWSRTEKGPDAAFSMEPKEFAGMVKMIREAEAALGKPSYGPGKNEVENVQFRKSLFVVAPIKKGERFTEKNIRSIRPGQGLPPKYYYQVLGKRAVRDIALGTPLQWNLIKK